MDAILKLQCLLFIYLLNLSSGEKETGRLSKRGSVEKMHSPYIPDLPASAPDDQSTDDAGKDDYVEYLPGSMALLLTVSHGGHSPIASIPDRGAGCFNNGACEYQYSCGQPDFDRCSVVTNQEDNTRELALKLRENLMNMTGHAPYVVISKLPRVQVDVDMDVDKGTFGDHLAMTAWNLYHSAIQEVKDALKDKPSLMLDLHGHQHTLQRTEFGYIINAQDLNKNDFNAQGSSILSLASRVSVSFSDLIKGKNSLGGLLEDNNFSAMPSPRYPVPNSTPYDSDSYSIRVHGSRDSGAMDAILVSSANSFRQAELLDIYAKDLSISVVQFMRQYYSLQIEGNVRGDIYKTNGSVKAAIVVSTFVGCFIIMGLVYVGRSKIRKFRLYRYERFAEEV